MPGASLQLRVHAAEPSAVDRIVHHSVILELNLKSYRAEEAQQRAAATNA